MQGKVKWFNSSKGFGFITEGDKEYFVHFSEIKMDGYKELKEGDTVSFDVAPGKNGGMQATNVSKL